MDAGCGRLAGVAGVGLPVPRTSPADHAVAPLGDREITLSFKDATASCPVAGRFCLASLIFFLRPPVQHFPALAGRGEPITGAAKLGQKGIARRFEPETFGRHVVQR